MATVRYSRLAESDLADIASYTLRTWGQVQTVRYLDELEAACRQLADDAALGRSCETIRPGLLRYEQGRHVFFSGVTTTVLRLLHQRMLPGLHLF